MRNTKRNKATQKLITIPEAAEAVTWLEKISTEGPTRNDEKQAMIVRGLIQGLQRCLQLHERDTTSIQ